mgnify:FL=1
MDECIFAMPSLNGFMPNEFYPQNLPSMLVSHILDVRRIASHRITLPLGLEKGLARGT